MKLLITGAIQWEEAQKRELQKMGHEIIYIQDERIPLKEQGIDAGEIEGTVCNGLFLYNSISDFKSLKYIQLTSAGLDRVPMEYVKEHQIEIYNARGVYSIPMAEFALCGVLQLYKQSHYFYDNQKKHCWEKNRDIIELSGKIICIIGCGSVGTECAKRFRAFGCKVIGIAAHVREDENYDSILGNESLEEVLPVADVLVLSLPLTEYTRYKIDGKRLGIMKDGAVVVNLARGAIVDTQALLRALSRFRGAVLDVFEEEPLGEDSPLWEKDNVILTPHNSFVGERNNKRLMNLIFQNLTLYKERQVTLEGTNR